MKKLWIPFIQCILIHEFSHFTLNTYISVITTVLLTKKKWFSLLDDLSIVIYSYKNHGRPQNFFRGWHN